MSVCLFVWCVLMTTRAIVNARERHSITTMPRRRDMFTGFLPTQAAFYKCDTAGVGLGDWRGGGEGGIHCSR